MPACASKRKCQKLQFALVRAAVLLIDCANQRRRHRRTVALQDVTDMAVGRRAQLSQGLFRAALAIQHDQFERMGAIGQFHPALRVHLLDAQAQIARDRLAGVRERPGHAFDQRQLDRFAVRRLRRCMRGDLRRHQRHGRQRRYGAPPLRRHARFLRFVRSADHRMCGAE
jgi:hypothetical protein